VSAACRYASDATVDKPTLEKIENAAIPGLASAGLSRVNNTRSKPNEIPKPAIEGWMRAAKTLHTANRMYLPRQASRVPNNNANKTIDLGVRY
jgi:hypothetical protein